jgi:hypothetical protein
MVDPVEKFDGWELKFAMSVARHAKRPAWVPSATQENWMRRLVKELRATVVGPDDDLIDDDDGGRKWPTSAG